MTTKKLQEDLATNLQNWKKVENQSMASTGQVMQATDNPVIHMIMEIIQRDSQMHYWVQDWIADTLQYKTVTFNSDDLNKVWHEVKAHIELERKMIKNAEEAAAAVKGKKALMIQEYLINYLLEDERKHEKLLTSMEALTKLSYP